LFGVQFQLNESRRLVNYLNWIFESTLDSELLYHNALNAFNHLAI
jgi:hypothetical protein